MDEYSFFARDGDRVCTVTLTDIQGELADDVRKHIAAEFEVGE
jgi:hypothetical protein